MTAFHEKGENPPSNLANAAIYIFDPRVRQLIAQSTLKESDISLHLIPQLLGKLNFWQTDGYCRDIGSMESLAKAEYDISKMNLY